MSFKPTAIWRRQLGGEITGVPNEPICFPLTDFTHLILEINFSNASNNKKFNYPLIKFSTTADQILNQTIPAEGAGKWKLSDMYGLRGEVRPTLLGAYNIGGGQLDNIFAWCHRIRVRLPKETTNIALSIYRAEFGGTSIIANLYKNHTMEKITQAVVIDNSSRGQKEVALFTTADREPIKFASDLGSSVNAIGDGGNFKTLERETLASGNVSLQTDEVMAGFDYLIDLDGYLPISYAGGTAIGVPSPAYPNHLTQICGTNWSEFITYTQPNIQVPNKLELSWNNNRTGEFSPRKEITTGNQIN